MRLLVAATVALGCAALLPPALAQGAGPPDEGLVPSARPPQPRIVEPRGEPDASAAPSPLAGLRGPMAGVGALEKLPLWQGRGAFGESLYGLEVRKGGGDLAVGWGPSTTVEIPSGYAAGFVWRRGRLRLQGDLLSGRNWLGRSEAGSLLSASLRMSEDLSLLIRYHTRSLSTGLDFGRENVVGGGFELDF